MRSEIYKDVLIKLLKDEVAEVCLRHCRRAKLLNTDA